MSADNSELLIPKIILTDDKNSNIAVNKNILAVRKFITFWQNGNESLARAVIAENYRDGSLPVGRPTGIEGILGAARVLHTAIPEISCEIEQLLTLGDRVITHLRFRGHFTGTFNSTQGQNQPVEYIAIDIYRLIDGLIVESWHLEDNLSLYTQLGVINAIQ
ncbi:polyketide cyclase [Xenorhabdus stockiae]|uniref:Polyketide cyclase n=1 Tax=Xenorhabdus stockiae TaxID=351614 RepID=A0A2D0KSD1_9GAMM|nr:ester cyclase [Xenorhabdus stockiae]PHM66366.1 polyketide cyclase [Xenorhabdus stockiae]